MGSFFHKKRIIYTVLAMAMIPGVMFLFVAFKPVRAVSVVFRPIGDSSIRQWSATPSSTHYLNVDDVITQPTAADTSDYVRLLGTGKNGLEAEEFYMGTPVSDSGNVSQIDLWMYVNDLQCKGTGSSNCDKLSVAVMGVGTTTLGVLPFSGTITPPVGSYGWRSLSFPVTASQTITFADMQTARVLMLRQVQGGGNSNNDEIRVAAVYLDVSYSSDIVGGGPGGGGGVPVVEPSTTPVTAIQVIGATTFGGGNKSVLAGETTTTAPVQGGATRYDGGAVTP